MTSWFFPSSHHQRNEKTKRNLKKSRKIENSKTMSSDPKNHPKNLPPSSKPGQIGPKPHFQNPPDSVNPDPATLRDQWRFAIRQYSRWYSQAWGSAILAGISFFALGWFIKGSNPLPSFKQHEDPNPPNSDSDPSEVRQAS